MSTHSATPSLPITDADMRRVYREYFTDAGIPGDYDSRCTRAGKASAREGLIAAEIAIWREEYRQGRMRVEERAAIEKQIPNWKWPTK